MRSLLGFVAAAAVSANPYNAPYSCHKPTDQEFYARDLHCYGVLKANLKMVPYARFAETGFNVSDVAYASRETMNRAFDVGERTGLSPYAVYERLQRETGAYIENHSRDGGRNGARRFIAGGKDLHECVADVFGRAND